MSRRLVITITVLLCLMLSSAVRAQQSGRTMVQSANLWLIHHNEIENVINLAYYSWVDGDGETFLSCFTPDVVIYSTNDMDPGFFRVDLTGKDELKVYFADKAEEVKKNYASRFLVVRHIHMKPESAEQWKTNGETGNAHGIAIAGVWETRKDNETGETTLQPYMSTYMMKRINGKWLISGIINKIMETPDY